MSIYATLWRLRFPRYGDDHLGCEWIGVIAQGVPPHIGSPTAGMGYEKGDPFADFLPPAVVTDEEGHAAHMRAVVIITEETRKGTARNGQEYVNPLLVLSGEDYAKMTFDELYMRICDALRGDKPRFLMQLIRSDGTAKLLFSDGSHREVDLKDMNSSS